MESATWAEFLTGVPPYTAFKIEKMTHLSNGTEYLTFPLIELHCEWCRGPRLYETENSHYAGRTDGKIVGHIFVSYLCNNCKLGRKLFALAFRFKENENFVMKLGEDPQYGAPLPSKMMSLVGPDRELFLKGRRSENQGLGIAAFTYYRRVIEDQRNRIFDELLRVLRATSPSSEAIADIESAKHQRQFSTSIEVIKHALPESLHINGHNPLQLLHSALSEGVHNLTDEECLQKAAAIRTVLAEFSNRLANAMKDDRELTDAIKLLVSKPRKHEGSSAP